MALSSGAVHGMNSGRTDMAPNVQLLDIKRISSTTAGAQDRYRLVISDGSRRNRTWRTRHGGAIA